MTRSVARLHFSTRPLPSPPAIDYCRGMSAKPVDTEQDDQLSRRLAALGVLESDLEESFVRSGGNGGQNVNKVSTCVMLRHLPTGLQVKCQTTRSQGQNRLLAREMLLAKLEALQRARAASVRAEIEKVRRQKRGRSAAAKRRMLADKSRRADKKHGRRTVGVE